MAVKVIVTGAAGFIGSHVVDLLCERGDEVVAVDNLDPAAHRRQPRGLHPGARWEWADVRDPGLWDRILPRADAVCHQAAKVGLGVDLGDAPAYVSANDLGTAEMLAALHRAGFDGRVVQASSMVVYGEGRYTCATHGEVRPGPRRVEDLEAGHYEPPCPQCGAALSPAPITEDAPTDPRNVYAATKLHQEHLGAAWAREHGGSVASLRYHNVYGPRMPRDTPYAGVMSLFRSALARGGPPRVFEDGGQLRDFVHVHDVARANLAALDAPVAHHGPLNVASGRPCSLLEAATLLCAADGRGLRPEVVGGHRLGDVRHVVGDPSRARAAIGYEPRVMPEEGIAAFASDPLREPPAT